MLFLRRGGLDDGGLAVLAEVMGLDVRQFRACMNSEDTKRRLQANLHETRKNKLRPVTPTFMVQGMPVVGSKSRKWWIHTVDRIHGEGGKS